jgi:hypothetical protein
MAIAGEAVRRSQEEPATVVGRLRDAGLRPILSIVVLTVSAFVIVLAADLSRLWLLASVLVGGAAVLIFFSSHFGWRSFHR